MSRLTLISWVSTALALLGFGTLAVRLLDKPLPPPAVRVRAGAAASGTHAASYDLVRKYTDLLARHEGQTTAPLAELPASPDEIAQAIGTAPHWAEDWDAYRIRRLYISLLLQLINFVPDPAHTSPEELWERQRAFIEAHRDDYRIVASGVETPVRIGRGFDALTAMHYARFEQMYLFWGAFATMAFMAVRGVMLGIQGAGGRFSGRWRVWGTVVFGVMSFCCNPGVFLLVPVAWLSNRMDDAAYSTELRNAVGALTLVVGFLVPFAVLSTLFDLLVHPPARRRHAREAKETDHVGSNP